MENTSYQAVPINIEHYIREELERERLDRETRVEEQSVKAARALFRDLVEKTEDRNLGLPPIILNAIVTRAPNVSNIVVENRLKTILRDEARLNAEVRVSKSLLQFLISFRFYVGVVLFFMEAFFYFVSFVVNLAYDYDDPSEENADLFVLFILTGLFSTPLVYMVIAAFIYYFFDMQYMIAEIALV